MNDISDERLYEGLVGYGLFTEELPPIFSSEKLLNKSLKENQCDEDDNFITFRCMRNINIPRTLGIPTPRTYINLCKILQRNWSNLKAYFAENTKDEDYKISRIHIRELYGEKKLFEMNYKNWKNDGTLENDLLLTKDKSSRFLVKSDISTCFPSIYTHSLSWALIGKEEAKKRKNGGEFNDQLDKACRQTKNGETHGLIIGPHASNLISEIILVKVDNELYKKGYRFQRHIDDYSCYVETYEEASRFIKDLDVCLRKYDLSINYKKTKITELPVANVEHWIHKLNAIQLIASYGKTSYLEVNNYIDTAIRILKETGDSAVLNYAIKTLAGMGNITRQGEKLAITRILHLAYIYPYLIPLVDQCVFKRYKVDKNLIEDFSQKIFNNAKCINNYEAMWYAVLYAIKYKFKLNNLDVDDVINSDDCILLVMTWLYYSKNEKQYTSECDKLKEYAKNLAKNKDDMDTHWVFCYEVLKKRDLKELSKQGKYNHLKYWISLKKKQISFIKKEYRTK